MLKLSSLFLFVIVLNLVNGKFLNSTQIEPNSESLFSVTKAEARLVIEQTAKTKTLKLTGSNENAVSAHNPKLPIDFSPKILLDVESKNSTCLIIIYMIFFN